jgi:hypothetical protein
MFTEKIQAKVYINDKLNLQIFVNDQMSVVFDNFFRLMEMENPTNSLTLITIREAWAVADH